jgi:hypothetical protein
MRESEGLCDLYSRSGAVAVYVVQVVEIESNVLLNAPSDEETDDVRITNER